MPSVKEVHYFDTRFCSDTSTKLGRARMFCARARERNPDRPDYLKKITNPKRMYTDAWYKDIFSIAPAGLKRGEITPSYCAIPEQGVAHIKATHPNVRLIYIIRDPLDRMISSLNMAIGMLKRKAGGDLASRVEQALEMPLFLPNGDYAGNIPRWDRYFPDVLYLPFGRVKTDPYGLLQDVERHIGVTPSIDRVNAEQPFRKVGPKPKIPERYIARLRAEAEPQQAYLKERFGAAFFAAI